MTSHQLLPLPLRGPESKSTASAGCCTDTWQPLLPQLMFGVPADAAHTPPEETVVGATMSEVVEAVENAIGVGVRALQHPAAICLFLTSVFLGRPWLCRRQM